jgi:hypothetical protein
LETRLAATGSREPGTQRGSHIAHIVWHLYIFPGRAEGETAPRGRLGILASIAALAVRGGTHAGSVSAARNLGIAGVIAMQ